MPNSYKKAIEEAKADIRSILVEVENLEKGVIESSSQINAALSKAFKGSSPNEFNEQLKKQQALIDSLDAKLSKLTDTSEQLKNKKKQLVTLTGKEAANNRILAKNADLQTMATSKLAGAYANLYARQRQQRRILRDLISSGKASRKEIKKAQKEYDRLSRKVNRANKATSNFSKNGLGRMIKGFRNLVGGFGLVLGIQLLGDFTKAVFNNLKVLDKLEFSLKAIIKNEGEVARTRAFLNDISIRYGAELISTTERYIKFLAAARQSNVTMADTERIFGTVTEAAGVMGLKTDELTGIYLALEQMLSKGKVTTEELRRQLGERLPGAFGIMADALGVTTVELDKMLRKGEVLSADALPKFEKALQKAFGLDKIDRVRTLQASVTNLTSSWQMLLESLRTGQGWISTVLMASFELMAINLRDISDLLLGAEAVARRDALAETFKRLQEETPALGKAASSIEHLTKRLKEAQESDASSALIGRIKGMIAAYNSYIKLIQDKANADALEKEELINKLILKDKSLTQAKLEAMSLEELRALWVKYNEEIEKGITALKGSIAWHENQIKTLEEERSKLAVNSRAYGKYTHEIEKANDALDMLKIAYEGVNSAIKKTTVADAIKDLKGVFKDMGLEEAGLDFKKFDDQMKNWIDDYKKKLQNGKDAMESYADFMKDVFGTVFDTFGQAFDIDPSKFDFIFDSISDKSNKLFSGENIGAWADLSKELIGGVLDASMKRYEIELQEAQRVRDVTLNNDLATQEEKDAAKRKYERKEREIKTKAAKQERTNTLIKIAVDTAAAVAKTLAVLGPAAPFAIPTILALGLTQAAFVASQPLPKFAGGTRNAPEGWAVVDEEGAEIHTDKHDNIKSLGSSGGANLRHLEKGDKIYTARESARRKHDIDDINRAVWQMNLHSNGKMLSENETDTALLSEVSGMRGDIDRMGRRIEKMASRPIKNTVNVELEDNRAY